MTEKAFQAKKKQKAISAMLTEHHIYSVSRVFGSILRHRTPKRGSSARQTRKP